MGEPVVCKDSERVSLLMSLALDGLLAATDQQVLAGHLAVCPACRAEWQAMQQVSDLFNGAEVVGPRLGFATRVERRLADKAKKRRRLFGGAAVLTGSLSLATVTAVVMALLVVGVVAWNWLDVLPDVKQGTDTASQIASGVNLMGKGVSLFLTDFLRAFGLPMVIGVGIALALLLVVWIWLFVKRPSGYHHNGYA
ncbi:MAG: zf-HC2 domain-containing protein [Anaerolineae bacterium]|nr:zf-HC2 domain-containing protein [Anaerolineae bacterium]